MNTFLWIMTPILAGIVIFLVSGLILLISFRRKNPHSDKKAAERARIAKRVKDSSQTSVDNKENGKEKILERLKERFGLGTKKSWTVLLILVGIAALFYRGFNTETGLIEVGNLSQKYWLQILIVYGIGAGLIWLNADEKSAKVLQKVLAGGVITLLLIVPWYVWVTSPSTTAQSSSLHSEIPLSSALPQNTRNLPRAWNKDGSMTDTSTWVSVDIPAKGNSVHVPGIFDGHVVWGGSGFSVHCVYTDGHEGIVGNADRPCNDGDIVESYVHNEGATILYASYAYAKRSEK